MRAVAVLTVLASHAGLPHASGGKTGVLMFFVISGFLITSILLRELEVTGRVSLRNFYGRRFLRLAPAMLLATAAYGTAALLWGNSLPEAHRTLRALGAGVFYVLNWWNIAQAGGNRAGMLGHYWSLSVEEQFYLLWPLFLILAYRYKQVSGVFWAAAVGAALSYAGKWFFTVDATRQTGTDFAGDALLAGCALACAMVIAPAAVAAVCRRAMLPGVLAMLVAFSLGNSTSGASAAQDAMYARVWWPIVVLGSCATVGALASDVAPRFITTFLQWRPIAYVGQISYGVYLWHILILSALLVVIPGSGVLGVLRLACVLAGTIGVAALSYELMEKRFLELKRHFASPPARAGLALGPPAGIEQLGSAAG